MLNMNIRPESSADIEAIARITEHAFRSHPYSQHTEQYIIDALRRAGALTVSLVAELDGEVVGHIAFSPAYISDGSTDWYALGPVAVTPALQKRGIGQALVNAGLRAIGELGAHGCVLVGDPGYYERFGFRSDPVCTMNGIPQEYVLSLPLNGHPQAAGVLTHHAAFHASGPGA